MAANQTGEGIILSGVRCSRSTGASWSNTSMLGKSEQGVKEERECNGDLQGMPKGSGHRKAGRMERKTQIWLYRTIHMEWATRGLRTLSVLVRRSCSH